MEEEIRRVAGIVLRAPLTRRTRRELLYCGLGGLAGVAGFWLTLVLLTAGFTVSASIIGTVIGLLLLTVALRVSRRLGSLHRRLLKRFLGHQVEAPLRFQPGSGLLGRLDRRLRDRAAWRGVWYSLIKLPVAAVQLYAIVLTVFGLVDLSYPVVWLLFRSHSGGNLSPLVAVVPVPFGGQLEIYSLLGTYPAAIAGAACVVAAAWLARGINAADRSLIRGLLGPTSMAERVSELERTRTLAVEDSAAALRRVERDLHDGAQMRLAALAMNLGMAREKLGEDDAAPPSGNSSTPRTATRWTPSPTCVTWPAASTRRCSTAAWPARWPRWPPAARSRRRSPPTSARARRPRSRPSPTSARPS